MKCPLCGIENESSMTNCYICDIELPKENEKVKVVDSITVETIDLSRPSSMCWNRVLGLGILVGFFLLPWLLMMDLYTVPEDVVTSMSSYKKIQNEYKINEQRWNDKKNQIVSVSEAYKNENLYFENIDSKVLFAFLEDSNVKFFPKKAEKPTIILSKKQKDVFPLMLSLEMQFDNEKSEFQPVRLRRGSRDIPIALAQHYFNDELDFLRQKRSVFQNITNIQWQNDKISWHYKLSSNSSLKR